MIIVATEWSSSAFSDVALVVDGVDTSDAGVAGGGGTDGSNICCNVADAFSSLNCGTTSTLCFDCVIVGVACVIARCKSFSNETINCSHSFLAWSVVSNCCCNVSIFSLNSFFRFRSSINSFSAWRNLLTNIVSRSLSSDAAALLLTPAVNSGSRSLSIQSSSSLFSSALYSSRFNSRSSRFIFSMAERLGADDNCVSSVEILFCNDVLSRSNASILDCKVRFSRKITSSFCRNSSRSITFVSVNSETSAS